MSNTCATGFVPVLSVSVDYGDAPFLWLVDQPDEVGVGRNLCTASSWDESLPLSESLWRKFADWALEFDRTAFYSETFDARDWDWIAFNERGLHLAALLKEEVGDAYRVIYVKPAEDPNHALEERIELLADGRRVVLSPFPSAVETPSRFCRHIVSGGQSGADRAALDFAIDHGYTHGGWAPKGRLAEDGVIAAKYQLTPLADGGYRQRTRRNVRESDGTLIVNVGELEGGTLATHVFAARSGKPCLVVSADRGVYPEQAAIVLAWLQEHGIQVLNVAGPRESKRPGIYALTSALLQAVDALNRGLPTKA